MAITGTTTRITIYSEVPLQRGQIYHDTTLREECQKVNYILEPQQTPHSYGVSIVKVLKKICRVLTAQLCIHLSHCKSFEESIY